MTRNAQNGFIALSAVLVLSAIFLVLAIGATQRGLNTTESALSVRQSARAASAARACAEYALMERTRTLDYTGGETRTVGEANCEILTFSPDDDGSLTIRTRSTVSEHTSHVIVEVGSSAPDVAVDAYYATTSF